MILARLAEYERRHETTPPYYTKRPLRYLIELDSEGDPLPGTPRDLANPDERSQRRGLPRPIPSVQRSVGVKPILFADKADYTLGPPDSAGATDRERRVHAAYLELVRAAAEETGLREVKAVLRFLESDPRAALRLPEEFDEGAAISFTVDGVWVVDLPEVQVFWREWFQDGNAPMMQCLICGEARAAMERLPLKVKGVPGGQTTGTSVISANKDAFESYGLKASLTSPVCDACAQGFTKGLNRLLADETTRIRMGSCVYVFWTRGDVGFDVASLLERPEPKDVESLLRSPWRGRPSAAVPSERFYSAAFSGSGGRAVVRDWIDATIPEVQEHLRTWFVRHRIIGRDGAPTGFGLWALAGATVRDLGDLPDRTVTELIRSALLGLPLPESLLAGAARRNVAEQSVTAPRAALIKAVLAVREQWKENDMVELDQTRTEPAYHCGRLLAVLERAQQQAIGVTAVTERYYGSASTAPASVFGPLVKGAVHHLAKLERDKPAAYHAIQRDLGEVTSKIDVFPRTLSLREQGLFALGYYHQRQARWAKKNPSAKEE